LLVGRSRLDRSIDVRPNPARRSAEIVVTLARPAQITIAAYDAAGREVARLHHGPLPAGTHRIPWATHDLVPGVYLVHVRTDGNEMSRRVAVSGR
jgi:hypothetical protein